MLWRLAVIVQPSGSLGREVPTVEQWRKSFGRGGRGASRVRNPSIMQAETRTGNGNMTVCFAVSGRSIAWTGRCRVRLGW